MRGIVIIIKILDKPFSVVAGAVCVCALRQSWREEEGHAGPRSARILAHELRPSLLAGARAR